MTHPESAVARITVWATSRTGCARPTRTTKDCVATWRDADATPVLRRRRIAGAMRDLVTRGPDGQRQRP